MEKGKPVTAFVVTALVLWVLYLWRNHRLGKPGLLPHPADLPAPGANIPPLPPPPPFHPSIIPILPQVPGTPGPPNVLGGN